MVQSNISIISTLLTILCGRTSDVFRRIANSAPCCVLFVCMFTTHLSPFLNSAITSFEQLKGALLSFLLLQILLWSRFCPFRTDQSSQIVAGIPFIGCFPYCSLIFTFSTHLFLLRLPIPLSRYMSEKGPC